MRESQVPPSPELAPYNDNGNRKSQKYLVQMKSDVYVVEESVDPAPRLPLNTETIHDVKQAPGSEVTVRASVSHTTELKTVDNYLQNLQQSIVGAHLFPKKTAATALAPKK